MKRTRRSAGWTSIAAVMIVAACSSSSGSSGGVSEGALEAKLKNEAAIKTLIDQGGAKAKVTTQLVGCIAKALEKDASPSDLKKYVDGKLDLADIGGKTKGAAADAKTVAQTCVQSAVKSGS